MGFRHRHRGRERALQCLYQWEATGAELDTLFERFWRAQPEPEGVRAFAEELTRGVVDAVEQLDPMIQAQARNWRLERMGRVDRSILRLGVYEMTADVGTPPAVVIDEAIELAKRFSGDQAGQFVNGILDGIRKRFDPDAAGAPDDDAATDATRAAGND